MDKWLLSIVNFSIELNPDTCILKLMCLLRFPLIRLDFQCSKSNSSTYAEDMYLYLVAAKYLVPVLVGFLCFIVRSKRCHMISPQDIQTLEFLEKNKNEYPEFLMF